jgi:hypothetical protein
MQSMLCTLAAVVNLFACCSRDDEASVGFLFSLLSFPALQSALTPFALGGRKKERKKRE